MATEMVLECFRPRLPRLNIKTKAREKEQPMTINCLTKEFQKEFNMKHEREQEGQNTKIKL